MFFTSSDAIRISFQTFGDPRDPAMLLIHGLAADGQMWGPQINTFPDQGYYLIVPDVRGHGQSSNVDRFSIKDCARDMMELVDHLGIETVTAAGVSMGGVIAQQMACDYPDYLHRLILCDTFSEVRSLKARIGGLMQWLTIKTAPGLFRKSLESVYKHVPDTLQYFQQRFHQIEKKQLLKARAALNRFNITERLSEIKIPTLVMAGDQFGDWFVKSNRQIAENIPNGRFVVLEHSMDPSNLVAAGRFNREVLGFLQKDVE